MKSLSWGPSGPFLCGEVFLLLELTIPYKSDIGVVGDSPVKFGLVTAILVPEEAPYLQKGIDFAHGTFFPVFPFLVLSKISYPSRLPTTYI